MSEDIENVENEDTEPGGSVPGFVLPIVTAGMALAVGAILGGIIGWVSNTKPPEVLEVPRELTGEELEAACAPLVLEAAENLEEAHEKVVTLEKQVADKEAAVEEMEAEMSRRYQRGVALVEERNALAEELAQAKTELAALKVALDKAIEEKEQLIVELRETQEELVVKTEEAQVAREDSLDNKWFAFQGRAQLEVCDKGRRKKLGKCREKIVEVLGPAMEEKYKYCIRSGQMVPSLHEFEKREQTGLPDFGEWLDQEDRITKDWYILLCDPTLPEAEDLQAVEHLLKVDEWTHLDGKVVEDTDGLEEGVEEIIEEVIDEAAEEGAPVDLLAPEDVEVPDEPTE